MTKVMAFGTFDILHPGHIFFLTEAKKLGDYLTVVIARDATVRKIKKRPPKHNEQERLQKVRALALADRVIPGNVTNKYQVIQDEKPDIVALGYDQTHFTAALPERAGGAVTIVRLSAFQPEVYKSSFLDKPDV